MSEEAAILFANDAFYHAFRQRDAEAMDALWARHASVACIHPGWQALTGRDEVMRSWRDILGNPDAPNIICRAARAYLWGDLGLVVCYELIGTGVLVATNVFLREDGTWKMVHHQAGPCGVPPKEIEEEPPPEPMQ